MTITYNVFYEQENISQKLPQQKMGIGKISMPNWFRDLVRNGSADEIDFTFTYRWRNWFYFSSRFCVRYADEIECTFSLQDETDFTYDEIGREKVYYNHAYYITGSSLT